MVPVIPVPIGYIIVRFVCLNIWANNQTGQIDLPVCFLQTGLATTAWFDVIMMWILRDGMDNSLRYMYVTRADFEALLFWLKASTDTHTT